MRIQDINHSEKYILELESVNNIKINENIPVKIVKKNDVVSLSPYNNECSPFEVNGKDKKNAEILYNIINRNLPKFTTILSVIDNKYITIEINMFSEEKPLDLSLGIDEKFIDKVKKIMKLESLKSPEKSLNDKFIIRLNEVNYCVIGINVNSDDEDYLKGFIVSGKDSYIYIKQHEEDGNKYFLADKVTNKINKQNYKFYLAKGSIKFVNASETEKARIETLALIKDIGNSVESYLNTWEEYGRIEQELVLEKAKKAGVIKYINCEYSPNKSMYRLDIDENSDWIRFITEIDDSCNLTLFQENPSEIINDNLTVDSYKKFVEGDLDRINCKIGEKIKSNQSRLFIKCNDIDDVPVNTGYIMFSLDGDISRFNRRKFARDKIMTAQCYMPHLAAILEGRSIPRPKRKKIEPLSKNVKEDIFPINDPTIMQKKAIDIALNTPDIAIIQGPPGTGKTTVILAILKRLNEISDSSDSIFGRNLISAFQHDAVTNAVERIEMLGLPAIKIGKKSGEGNTDPEVIEQVVHNWISSRESDLQKKHFTILKDSYIKKFDDIHNNILHSANTLENTIKLLEETKDLLCTKISYEINNRIDLLLNNLKKDIHQSQDSDTQQLINYIYGIPCSIQEMNDNGIRKLKDVILYLNSYFAGKFDNEIQQLKKIILNYSENTEQLNEIKSLRKKILLDLIPKDNLFSTPKQKEEVLTIFNDISNELRNQNLKTIEGEKQVLLDYISAFESNPLAIRNAVLEYVSVLGATNQQAIGNKIKKLKGDEMHYDNVLIDEAARSNPLDLFIPMSLAKDRIILVGDHRQLPHIVDDKILKDIENNLDSDNESLTIKVQNNIQKSMFEHLFITLKQLEKQDGIQRTVTLDKQYRTHPVLGNFVSNNFYEKHGESRIDSPLPPEHFDHNIKGLEHKACVWMNVPINLGEEGSSKNGSKYRKIEAEKIVAHLKEIINEENTKTMSFGIITFYSEQVKVIYEELIKAGIASKNENNTYEILPKYKYGEKNGKKFEKLRIGTVDSFQGMEFDIVYLSTVRSNTLSGNSEKERRSKYGFLTYENRLCVSMSRQKKMLIVVGDSDMLEDPNADKAVQSLINYYNLCKNEVQYGSII